MIPRAHQEILRVTQAFLPMKKYNRVALRQATKIILYIILYVSVQNTG
ncbi:MAG: hypothetical protein JXA28_05315 [Bacteroidetes bacterium]|nr:hypothetical protein [Bacteroidota bacterium]